MSEYMFNINENTNSIVKIGELEEYKQGIRGNFKIEKIPNKNQDVELSKIYVGYCDYYIGEATPEGELICILSTSKPNDIMLVEVSEEDFDFEFTLETSKKYKIINRTRFVENSHISLGFDFEKCKVKKIGDVLIYGRDGDEPEIPLTQFLGSNIVSPSSTFSVIPDESAKLKNIHIGNSKVVLASSCENVFIGDGCDSVILGKRCGFDDGEIKINDNCKNIVVGDDSGINGNIVVEKNCENISFGKECGNEGLVIVEQNSGNNGGKIEFGFQCGNQALILIGKNCANQEGSLISLGCGDSESFIGESFTAAEGIQNGVYVL